MSNRLLITPRKRMTPLKRVSHRLQGGSADIEVNFGESVHHPALKKHCLTHRNDRSLEHGGWDFHSTRKRTSITQVEGIDFSPLKKKATPDAPKKAPRKVLKNPILRPVAKETDLTHCRSIVEHDAFRDMVLRNTVCRKCKKVNTLTIGFPALGVATRPYIHCSSDGCQYTDYADVELTGIDKESVRAQLIDYDANFKFVQSFVASGDGSTEASRFLSFMSLPNAPSMLTSSFRTIEETTSPVIESITKEKMEENLIAEVALTMKDDPEFDLEIWKHNFKSGRPRCSKSQAWIGLGNDMGWQCKGSGRRYDSQSGHAICYGVLLRRACMLCTKSKFCSICNWYSRRDGAIPPEHECTVNHVGSSGSMESDALLEMVHRLWDEYLVEARYVVTDDDSTMKANCRWSNKDWMAHHGRTDFILGYTELDPNNPKSKIQPIKRKEGYLRYPIPQPLFLGDPAHRKKSLKTHLYKMLRRRKDDRFGLAEGDILRVSQFFIYMVRQLKDVPEEQYEEKGKAVLEHHFDCHEYCGSFCLRKKETPEERKESKKVYRCKEKDDKLYSALSTLLEDFVCKEALCEVAHGWDTNPNESMNNTISWLAPKNKTYSGTKSLRNRICTAVSIQSMGYDEYYIRLFRDLGMTVDPLTIHRLRQGEKHRQKKLRDSKKDAHKKRRQETNYAKIKKYFEKLAADRAKGKGYKKAGAIGGRAAAQCPHCGLFGHKTTRSKKCLRNPKNPAYVEEESQEAVVPAKIFEHTIIPGDEVHHTDTNMKTESLEVSLLDAIPCATSDAGEIHDLTKSLDGE